MSFQLLQNMLSETRDYACIPDTFRTVAFVSLVRLSKFRRLQKLL
jgi:hypothetical protein